MAVASTTDHSTTRDTLIKDALIECHVIAIDETPTASQVTHADRVLNDMVKHLSLIHI